MWMKPGVHRVVASLPENGTPTLHRGGFTRPTAQSSPKSIIVARHMKQKKRNKKKLTAERVYAVFLHLYPRAHRQALGPLMLQAFKDSYRDARETEGRRWLQFWLEVVSDEAKSIVREYIAALKE